MKTKPISAELLLGFLETEEDVERVGNYFSGAAADPGPFTGRRFERFAGGGYAPAVANRFTSDDVVALSMLSINLHGAAAIELLETRAHELNALLSAVPGGLDLWHDDAEVGTGSTADTLWHALKDIEGVGWVTAGKLMARKRPRLIPVYDNVVKEKLGRADGEQFWEPLRDVLRTSPEVLERLSDVRDRSHIGDDISLLRVLDVAIWTPKAATPPGSA